MVDDRDNEKHGFLSRWSDLKYQHSKKDVLTEETTIDNELNENNHEEPQVKKEIEKQENREQAEAIDIETLTDESDYTIFFRDGVSESLKQAALRKLWRTNPVFANLDGLNDYDENFSSTKMVLETFESAWKVGKGYLTNIDDLEKRQDEYQISDASNDESISQEDNETGLNDKGSVKNIDDSPDQLSTEALSKNFRSEMPDKNSLKDRKEQTQALHLSLRSRLKIER